MSRIDCETGTPLGTLHGVYINGKLEHGMGRPNPVVNPWTTETSAIVFGASDSQVNDAVFSARKAHRKWDQLGFIGRADYLIALADNLQADLDNMAQVITEEQGKTLEESRQEVRGACSYLKYMAGWARRIEGEILPNTQPNEYILLFRKSYGVVAAILPWNFPLFILIRKIAPALLAGNTVVVKPSELTPLSTLRFCELVDRVQLPAGAFNVICGDEIVGQQLVAHQEVNMITFTGSTDTGRSIMRTASSTLAKLSLELGGNAPAIVLQDADLDVAVQAIYDSRVENAGQVCNCTDRVYVHRDMVKEFTRRISEKMAGTHWGNPWDPSVTMGPLVTEAQRQRVVRMVGEAVRDGARIETGGHAGSDHMGYCFEPTVLSGCRHEMTIVQNEIFGPVLPIIPFDSVRDAVAMANDTQYGLTSSLFTRDLNLAMEVSDALEFGETFINRENGEVYSAFHSGWKQSGLGGDDGRHGLEEFMQYHVTYIRYPRTLGRNG